MKDKTKIKKEKRKRRHLRIRAKVKGTTTYPRLSVFRSNKHICSQLIDDERGYTLLAANDREIKNFEQKLKIKNLEKKKKEIIRSRKVAIAYEVGKLIAKKALKKGIKKVVFDRGGYRYHGRVKAVAEGAREEGLKF